MDMSARRMLAGFAFLIGLAAILGAWGFQIFGGYVPCKLCLEQRIPYYAGLPALLAGFLLLGGGARAVVARVLLLLGALAFLVGLGLGIYHAGVEWGFWLGPADCGGGVATTKDAGDLLGQIGRTKVVSCTEAAWRFLGLSFAGWNAVVSAIVAALAARAALARS
jgi:disulfide bond formation protein DsbB